MLYALLLRFGASRLWPLIGCPAARRTGSGRDGGPNTIPKDGRTLFSLQVFLSGEQYLVGGYLLLIRFYVEQKPQIADIDWPRGWTGAILGSTAFTLN